MTHDWRGRRIKRFGRSSWRPRKIDLLFDRLGPSIAVRIEKSNVGKVSIRWQIFAGNRPRCLTREGSADNFSEARVIS